MPRFFRFANSICQVAHRTAGKAHGYRRPSPPTRFLCRERYGNCAHCVGHEVYMTGGIFANCWTCCHLLHLGTVHGSPDIAGTQNNYGVLVTSIYAALCNFGGEVPHELIIKVQFHVVV